MKRRTLLTQFAGVGAAAAVAGCIADRPGSNGSSEPEEQPAAIGDDNQSDADGTGGDNESDGDDVAGDTKQADGSDDAGVSSPELTGTDVTTHDATCSSDGEKTAEATVSFGDKSVAVEGTISAPDPCHEAAVKTAAYSDADDEFRLTVTTAPAEKGGVCADCVAAVSYVVDASFEGGLPANVVVTHDGAGRTEVVTDVVRE